MIQIPNTNLFVGNINDNKQVVADLSWAIVHATQTIHYQLMGWDRRFNKPPKNHPNYIVYENGDRLSLNWVDGEAFLYNWSGSETFIKVLDFVDQGLTKKQVLIHCDQGQSRSPTLALLYLAKRQGLLSKQSFAQARAEFEKIYPTYSPSGIAGYVAQHWEEID